MNMRRSIPMIACVALGILLTGCHRLQPLRAPTFQVSTTDQTKLNDSIRQALLDRHWSIIARRPDGFDIERS